MKDKAHLAKHRAAIISKVRHFFDSREFIEIPSPTLVINPGLEPHLLYFETQFNPSMGGGQNQTWYLPTSPEYHLKKALSWGLPKIYEICKSYRNGEISSEHEPEFMMLEWYRSPGDYQAIAKDTEDLIRELGTKFNPKKNWQNFKHTSVSEAFKTYANMDLDLALQPHGVSLCDQALNLGMRSINRNDTFEDCFHKILLEFIEPNLGTHEPEFLWDYPEAFAALSRPHPQKAGYCERFELYIEGIEIANAFGELMDSAALRRTCQKDHEKRLKMYSKSPPLDEEFLKAVEQSPHKNVGGIALGLDRLIQVLIEAPSLQDAILFPKRPTLNA